MLSAMPTILDEIIAHKRAAELPLLPPVDRVALRDLPPCRGFRVALRRAPGESVHVIAESKKGSPSKGVIARDYDPVLNAFRYVHGGAHAMSVLTDAKFFLGCLDDLVKVRAAVQIPLIRKDFTVDPRQIAEARLAGADAILLIAACLEQGLMRDLHGFAREIGLDVLVEVHDAEEASRALAIGADLVGVNNRNLKDFSISLQTTLDLAPGLIGGGRVVVAESGISRREECLALERAGIDAILVGESLMVAADPAAGIGLLRGSVVAGRI